jgi:hypothetical protein
MGRKIIVLMLVAGMGLVCSCGRSSKNTEAGDNRIGTKVMQQQDGTISLNLDKADRYSDMVNRTCNTAEWDVVVSKSGRYNVWIASATRDTTDLRYKDKVRVSVQDENVEARPACDKIILHSGDVSYPWFRADSFMGAMYIQDTGVFHVQVISEQILPKDYKMKETSGAELSKLISVYLTPATR